MLRLKPTVLLSLDCHAAAFCERVQDKLELDLGYSGSLIQSHALIVDGSDDLKFEKNLTAIADFSFNLNTIRQSQKLSADQAQSAFESKSATLEPELSEILEAGRRAAEVEKARQVGIEIASNRMVYLLLSSADRVASGVVIELARLIRWLFATRFSQELYELHAVVFLPNLFEQPLQADFAAAYALLKKLDHSSSSGLTITALRKMPPFTGCWLMDGINSRGEKIGTLAEELDGYTDAFTGFLTAEPEMSGALPGTRTCRGKVPAYSAFGHGELYLPSEVAVLRLSSALSRDIIDKAFLSEQMDQPDLERETLLATKQIVLNQDYRSAFNGLETDKGALIWQDLPRTAELQRENNALEYVVELQRYHSKFERESLPRFKQALVARGEATLKVLVNFLDAEIDRRIDEKVQGLRETPALLQRLVDYSIALHANSLGERPENFITDLLAAEAMLDSKLGVEIDNSKTEQLLKEVYELTNRLVDLENTLRISNAQVSEQHSAADGAAAISVETESEADEGYVEERIASEHSLHSDIEETRSEIASTSAAYVRELITEQRVASQVRYEAKDKARAKRAEAVTHTEEEISTTAQLLTNARLDLDDKQRQRHQFLVRHFIVYPAIASLLVVVPALAAALGIPFALMLTGLFWASVFGFLLVTLLTFAAYTAGVLYAFITGINRKVNAARDELNQLELRLKAARVRLIEARNLQSRLEYDIYAQSMRVETLNKLIKATRERIDRIENTFTALNECRTKFVLQHAAAAPSSSYMRRPVLAVTDIDNYYPKIVTDIRREAASFIGHHMARSQVRHFPIEDFERRLQSFTRSRFQTLTQLSIEDVLLRSPDLISKDEAGPRLEELDRAATPLVLLSEMDLNDDAFAQKDVTIWAGGNDGESLLHNYRKVNLTTSIRPSSNAQTLRALTRCVNFPAFYLSQIEFYRSCYERADTKDGSSLPDLVPDELTISSDSRRAYENLLVAIATGVISRNGDGAYQLEGGGYVVGTNRRQIAEKFAVDYSSQTIYAEIADRVARSDSDEVYKSVVDFMQTALDLDTFEREMLIALSKKYHPLR